MKNENSFLGEWVFWENEEELKDAYIYLELWKKFILKRLPEMEQVGNDHLVLRPADVLGRGTLGMKIEMKGKLPENVLPQERLNNIISD
jgi:hypothetical protein